MHRTPQNRRGCVSVLLYYYLTFKRSVSRSADRKQILRSNSHSMSFKVIHFASIYRPTRGRTDRRTEERTDGFMIANRALFIAVITALLSANTQARSQQLAHSFSSDGHEFVSQGPMPLYILNCLQSPTHLLLTRMHGCR